MKKLTIILFIALSGIISSSAQVNKDKVLRMYTDSLELSNTPTDSIRLLYNIFDIDSRHRKSNAMLLLDLVSRYGDQSSQLDMIRQTANLNSSDTAYLQTLLAALGEFTESPEVLETRLFLRLSMVRNPHASGKWEECTSRKQVAHMLADYLSNPPTRAEDRVVKLYEVIVALAGASRGPLLATYVNSLQDLVEKMNLPTGAVRNFVYSRSSILFTAAHDPKSVVATEKKLLNIMDSLSHEYAVAGRPFRTFPVNRYISYRRLLQNASALTEPEIEQYYSEVKALAEADSAVSQDIAHNHIVDIYYLMATKDYANALPLIQRQLAAPERLPNFHANLTGLMYEAAKHTGQTEVMRSAAEKLYPMAVKELEDREQYRLNDLRILYQSDSIRATETVKSNIEQEQKQNQLKAHRVIVSISIIALMILAVFIVFLVRQRSKILTMAERLKNTNNKLVKERNDLRQSQADLIEARDASKAADKLKTDFINNMSHEIKTPLATINEYSRLIVDCIPDDKRPYLDKFANVISINSKIILTLVNDVLDVASLSRKEMSINNEPVEANSICEVAISNVFGNSNISDNGQVTFIFEPMEPSPNLITDPQRVGQVLTNLLSNARKFTEKGHITFSYTTVPEAKTITFSVADTGIGIPKGMEEVIFDRFRQLDQSAQGTGLGLYIARLLATMLGGTVRVDTEYRGGARFLFTIPTGM